MAQSSLVTGMREEFVYCLTHRQMIIPLHFAVSCKSKLTEATELMVMERDKSVPKMGAGE
jgi:hypothetical protein